MFVLVAVLVLMLTGEVTRNRIDPADHHFRSPADRMPPHGVAVFPPEIFHAQP